MNDPKESFERDMYWLKALITDNVSLIGWLAIIALVGHKSFGWPDFGITPFYLFAIALVGVFLIGFGTFVVGKREDGRIRRGLQENGFTEAEISEITKNAG